MSQRINFCTAADGVRIAYATAGDGPPLVYVTGWPGHLELEWRKPFARRFLEDLGRSFTLIRYDMRGSGLSDRDVGGFSLDRLLLDLEAVVGHLQLRRFALLSLGDLAGPLSITYATSHPGAVNRLILNSPFARGRDLSSPEDQRAMIEFVGRYGFPTFEFIDAPGIEIQAQRDVRELVEQGAAPAVQAEILKTLYASDVSDLLDSVSVPTLVLHARGDTFVPFNLGREVAGRIAGAEFIPFEGAGNAPWAHRHVIIQEVRRFLGGLLSADADEPRDAGGLPDNLTAREAEVLRLVASGRSSREIAATLTLSVRTVERHITNVYRKTGVRTRAQATAYALRSGLSGWPSA